MNIHNHALYFTSKATVAQHKGKSTKTTTYVRNRKKKNGVESSGSTPTQKRGFMMSTTYFYFVDYVGPPSAEVCRTSPNFRQLGNPRFIELREEEVKDIPLKQPCNLDTRSQIGRASCRERVCLYV